MKSSLRMLLAMVIVIFPAATFSSPEMKVDSADFNAGIVREGAVQLVKHTYIVRNTGDSALIISEVRPGCGCTTAGFDSVIQPGKTGRINVVVNAEHFGEGEFQKRVTVTSNAEKSSPFILIITGVKRNIVSTEPDAVRFEAGREPDTGVTFAPTQTNEPMNWRSSIPLSFSFTRMPDSIRAASPAKVPGASAEPQLAVYKLKITRSPGSKEDEYGNLTISTTLPDKPEVKISAMIVAAKR